MEAILCVEFSDTSVCLEREGGRRNLGETVPKGFLRPRRSPLFCVLVICSVREEESCVDGPAGLVQDQGHSPPGDMKPL